MAAPKTRSRTSRAKAATQAAEVKEEKVTPAKEEPTNGSGNAADAKAAAEAEKEAKREAKAREKQEAEDKARQAKIDSGDLIVDGDFEYEANTKETKTSSQVASIVDEIKESDAPVVFSVACEHAGAKYPEDILPALLSLEHIGLVRRFDARHTGEESLRRRTTAFLWIGDK